MEMTTIALSKQSRDKIKQLKTELNYNTIDEVIDELHSTYKSATAPEEEIINPPNPVITAPIPAPILPIIDIPAPTPLPTPLPPKEVVLTPETPALPPTPSVEEPRPIIYNGKVVDKIPDEEEDIIHYNKITKKIPDDTDEINERDSVEKEEPTPPKDAKKKAKALNDFYEVLKKTVENKHNELMDLWVRDIFPMMGVDVELEELKEYAIKRVDEVLEARKKR